MRLQQYVAMIRERDSALLVIGMMLPRLKQLSIVTARVFVCALGLRLLVERAELSSLASTKLGHFVSIMVSTFGPQRLAFQILVQHLPWLSRVIQRRMAVENTIAHHGMTLRLAHKSMLSTKNLQQSVAIPMERDSVHLVIGTM
jgi:hypothetical protein